MRTKNTIVFADTEIDPQTGKILDIGSIKGNKDIFHSGSAVGFAEFIKDSRFLCGHNIINHDLNYIRHTVEKAGIDQADIIDTLFVSPLLFPARPYHALLKDDKLQTQDIKQSFK